MTEQRLYPFYVNGKFWKYNQLHKCCSEAVVPLYSYISKTFFIISCHVKHLLFRKKGGMFYVNDKNVYVSDNYELRLRGLKNDLLPAE